MKEPSGFTSIGEILGGFLKEIQRRNELRQRLQVELARTLTDEEFIAIAERTGMRI